MNSLTRTRNVSGKWCCLRRCSRSDLGRMAVWQGVQRGRVRVVVRVVDAGLGWVRVWVVM